MRGFEVSRVLTRSDAIAWSIHYQPHCDSTQDLARAALQAGAEQGWTVVTDEQRAGRGRHGRVWVAPAGSALLFSFVLGAGVGTALLPLLAGIAVGQGIQGVTELQPDLKWPNDLLHEGRKLAGILVERPSETWIVVGIGINVNTEPGDLPEQATSLRQALGHSVKRELLLGGILDALDQAVSRTGSEGPAWIVPAWRRRSRMLGRRVTFLHDGQTREGVAEDLAADGALRVRLDDGREVSLVAGDVRQIRTQVSGQS